MCPRRLGREGRGDARGRKRADHYAEDTVGRNGTVIAAVGGDFTVAAQKQVPVGLVRTTRLRMIWPSEGNRATTMLPRVGARRAAKR